MVTRRDVLQALPLSLGLASSTAADGRAARPAQVPSTPAPRDSSFDPWVEIRKDLLIHNVGEVRRRAGGRPILAVVKNDGYGAGVANIAGLFDPLPDVAALAVVKLHEAMAIRDAGVSKPVLLMGPFDDRDLEEAVGRDIMPMVYTPVGDTLDRIAARRQRPAPIHINVDTGIGRVGVPVRDAEALVTDLARRRSVRIDGIMMTFSEDPDFDREQLVRFNTLTGRLAGQGVSLGRRHAASSFALFDRPEGFLDMVRPGMALYGVYSEPAFRTAGVLDLQPAVSLKSRVAYVKKLTAGESAGYNRAYVARTDVHVATLPVGHADGWPRAAAKGARVAINGRLYPVIASVSASHTIIEVGSEPAVRIGDEATFFGAAADNRPEDVAQSCGASVYDLMMHLNPLLPRRVISGGLVPGVPQQRRGNRRPG
jgi:alanine racemase